MTMEASRLELAMVLPSGVNVSHMTDAVCPLKMKLRGCVFKNSVTVSRSSALGTGSVFSSAMDKTGMPVVSTNAAKSAIGLHSRVIMNSLLSGKAGTPHQNHR